MKLTLRDIQAQLRPWQEHNFNGRPAWQPLLGVAEEVGELCHSFLKKEQNIRGTPEEHDDAIVDAVGDIMIFLLDFCNAQHIDAQAALETTWLQVRERDWRPGAIPAHPTELGLW